MMNGRSLTMAITIHIADDHSMFRAGLRALIEKESDLSVTGESGNSFETLDRVRAETPGMSTSAVSRRFRRRCRRWPS
jgi:DNA-binding NarL/FixJ family response regulator